MWIAVATITSLALAAGALLACASRRLPGNPDSAIEQVNRLVPQPQCSYPGCEPCARAIVTDDAPISLCPPGGDDTVRRIADLLYHAQCPRVADAGTAAARAIARIDEAKCVGCTHRLRACPVDAIVGAHQYMHTVIKTEGTGSELCVAPCPVDCISMGTVR